MGTEVAVARTLLPGRLGSFSDIHGFPGHVRFSLN